MSADDHSVGWPMKTFFEPGILENVTLQVVTSLMYYRLVLKAGNADLYVGIALS